MPSMTRVPQVISRSMMGNSSKPPSVTEKRAESRILLTASPRRHELLLILWTNEDRYTKQISSRMMPRA